MLQLLLQLMLLLIVAGRGPVIFVFLARAAYRSQALFLLQLPLLLLLCFLLLLPNLGQRSEWSVYGALHQSGLIPNSVPGSFFDRLGLLQELEAALS